MRFFPEVHTLLVGETVTAYANYRSVLLSSETLSTASAAITGSTDLTVASAAVLAADIVVNGSSLLASKAMSFKVSGQLTTGGWNGKGGYHVLTEVTTSGGDTRRGIAQFVTSLAS